MLNNPNICIIETYPDGAVLFHTDWYTFRTYPIQNWEKNRPPNLQRIQEIGQAIQRQGYTDGILYLFRFAKDVYMCYDGIHRFEALRGLPETHNPRLLVHYVDEYNEEWVERKFKQLNKCIPVPELYTESQHQLEHIRLIQSAVDHVLHQYPKIFTISARPRTPNQSRDVLTDQISELVEHVRLNDKNAVCGLLDRWNTYMRRSIETTPSACSLSPKQVDKCRKTRCFMFASKDWVRLCSTAFLIGNL